MELDNYNCKLTNIKGGCHDNDNNNKRLNPLLIYKQVSFCIKKVKLTLKCIRLQYSEKRLLCFGRETFGQNRDG